MSTAHPKMVYRFGDGEADGTAKDKELLGGKGANLAEMCQLGVPVPPGFTITTEVCTGFYQNNRAYPDGLKDEVARRHQVGRRQGGRRLWRSAQTRCWCRCAQARASPCPA
jgi:pyruvate,orthophosphate dikinase